VSGTTWGATAAVALAAALLVAPGPVGAPRRVARAVRPGAGAPPIEGPVVPSRLLPPLLGLAVAGSVAVLAGGPGGAVLAIGLGVGVALGWPRLAARRASPRPDPLSEAAAWDQMAACLRAGLPLERAVRAVVPVLPAGAGDALGRVADLLVLGADPATAWAPALDQPSTAGLARAARRSARSGAAVAAVAEAHAADVRAEAADAMGARAERAGVLVTGPLGLCFLPAFLALGIVPVVVGLAGPLLEQR
jgi:Flp pilus assembly protein TadB